jgi:hypothetical protein
MREFLRTFWPSPCSKMLGGATAGDLGEQSKNKVLYFHENNIADFLGTNSAVEGDGHGLE